MDSPDAREASLIDSLKTAVGIFIVDFLLILCKEVVKAAGRHVLVNIQAVLI